MRVMAAEGTMNIILVSDRLAKSRTITLTGRRLMLAGVVFLVAGIVLVGWLQFTGLRWLARNNAESFQALFDLSPDRIVAAVPAPAAADLRRNLNAMAVRVGRMQAQLLRLNVLGERLAQLAGFKLQDLMMDRVPGQGGPAPAAAESNLSASDLATEIDRVARRLDSRGDAFDILQSALNRDRVRKQLRPSELPVQGAFESSPFGWRIDPFKGTREFHDGVDLAARPGTPVTAAAGGIVVFSGSYPGYGNMVEIDHGNGLTTRYAHMSKCLVKIGDVVFPGTPIGTVGSTGRSTGAHLHFEVRSHGTPLDPSRFVRLPG
jgi:murein DD-endopeptidase MepM/ murein hydrolase activator NlpD